MSVLADPAEEKVESAGLLDGLLVILALGLEVRSISIEDVNVLCRLVNVVEELFMHK